MLGKVLGFIQSKTDFLFITAFVLYSLGFLLIKRELINGYSFFIVFFMFTISLYKNRLLAIIFTNLGFIYILILNQTLGIIAITEYWVPNRFIYIIILNTFTFLITYVVHIRKNLEQTNDNLVEMVQILKHDLTTPMNAIISYLDLMKDEGKGSLQYLTRIENQVYYINNFIAKSLEIVNYRQPVALHKISLSKVIMDIKEFYNGNIIIDYLGEEEVNINADGMKVMQMLINIVDNAIKHGQATQVQFQINKRIDEQKYYLQISNNGKKIEPKQLDLLWHKHVLQKYDQSGLGMTVVQNIVKAHNWNIKLEIEPKTNFIIEIPLLS